MWVIIIPDVTLLVMAKLRVFICHLIWTAVLIVALVALVFGVWYADGWHQLTQVTWLLGLLTGVLLIFPLLSAWVYHPHKKSRRSDIIIIGLLQLAVLLAGIYALAQTRPAWLVLFNKKIYVVRSIDLRQADGSTYHMPWSQQPWGRPKLIGLIDPTTEADKKLMNDATFYGSTALYPQLYQPLDVERLSHSRWQIEDIFDPTLKDSIVKQYPNVAYYLPVIDTEGKERAMALFDEDNHLIQPYYPQFLNQ